MKLTASSRSLAECLGIVGRAVPPQPAVPVLSNVLIDAAGDSVRMRATTLEFTITATVGANVQRPGRITAPARLLTDFVSSIADAPCTLTRDARAQTLGVRCGRHEGQFHGLPAEDFPPLPPSGDEGSTRLEVLAGDLRRAITQTAHAAAPAHDSRPVLTGVALSVEDERMTLAATDGHRLAAKSLPLADPQVGPELDGAIIVAARHLTEVARLLSRDDGVVTVTVSADRNHVRFETPGIDVVSRLIEGRYPEYRQVIPRDATTRVHTQTADLLREVRTASVLAAEATHPLQLDIAAESVRLVANTAEVGRDEATVPVETVGNATQISLNARYVLDALSCMDTERVTLALSDALTPCTLRPGGTPNDDYIYVIMPVRVPAT
jgi:DNA polymerase III subunit beta